MDIEKPSRFHGSRSRSSQSLRNLCDPNVEEKLNILVPLFWTFVSLLESDNEFEFYLALRSLDKVIVFFPGSVEGLLMTAFVLPMCSVYKVKYMCYQL